MKFHYFVPLVLCLACAKDATSTTAGSLPASSVAGTWAFALGDSIACADSVMERSFTVNVSGTDDDVEPAGSLPFTDTWTSASALAGPVYGSYNLSSRIVIMHLTMVDTLSHALELVGRLDDTLALHGRATDPYAGYATLVTTGGCKFDFSGQRVSP
ncbi:MAG: hypothetical protein ABI613_11195 [Gemmatimonadota bacterium]